MDANLARKKQEVLGACQTLGALYLAVSLFSYSRWDPSFFASSTYGVKNYGGMVGAYLSDLFFAALGVSAFLVPFFLAASGVRRFMGSRKEKLHMLGAVVLILAFSLLTGLTKLVFVYTGWNAGGYLGATGAVCLVRFLSTTGGYIVVFLMIVSSGLLLSPVSVGELISRDVAMKRQKRAKRQDVPAEPPDYPVAPDYSEEDDFDERADDFLIDSPLPEMEPEADVDKAPLPLKAGADIGGYALPPLSLLNEPASPAERQSKEDIAAGSALLEKKLRDFGIQGRVTQVHAGPVVTMYEFEPAPGVKIQKVVTLAEDLSLSMKALSTRIAPVPGKAALGIEIPNKQREVVLLRDIISSEGFRKSPSRLTIALGKDIFGNPVLADLARMPHLLVAGATGSGKSVCLNSIIASILYKAAPSEVKMLMIDPKLLELLAYEGIPHLISPVITGPKPASEALKKMVFEMERRYRIIAEKGAKSIEGFNRMARDEERLPYIVVIIDELADLMLSSAAEVEDSIARLAQMARASGIHLILATQRPSVDVITGVIKVNFPTRVSFQVASRIDSRTIIDSQGAEQLIGRGDMLLLSPGARIMRVHGAYVSEPEIKAVADFLRAQRTPDYGIFESIKAPGPDEAADPAGTERDELYERAVEMAAAIGEVSISSLQRRLKIGFNRAARIVELMEEDGLIGPPRGAGKPRMFIGKRHFN